MLREAVPLLDSPGFALPDSDSLPNLPYLTRRAKRDFRADSALKLALSRGPGVLEGIGPSKTSFPFPY